MAVKKTITVKQVGSSCRCQSVQAKTLLGLGLGKMHRTRTLEDTPAVRGMIKRIGHLVRVVDAPAAKKT